MIWNYPELMKALHRAREVAKIAGRAPCIVANTGSGLLARFRRAWRVELNPTPSDTVLIKDIGASYWSREMSEAYVAAFREIPDAAVALHRLLEHCAFRDDGQPRSEDDRADLLLKLGDAMASGELRRAMPAG